MKLFPALGKYFIVFLLACTYAVGCKPKDPNIQAEKDINDYVAAHKNDTAKMEWWNKARFGMFIHFGVYSQIAGNYGTKPYPGLGEWIMRNQSIPVANYTPYSKSFNPVSYNPQEWVSAAKKAGMKYIVFTAKHHEGFAMFATQYGKWDIMKDSPYGKDILKPLAEECRKQGLKLGIYYSQANDWVNPGGAKFGGAWDKAQEGVMNNYLDSVAVPQVRELLTNYGDVAEFWFDFPTDMARDRAVRFLPLLKLQPNMIVNDRLGGQFKGDFETPEQRLPPTAMAKNWETCMTMNDTWGYKTADTNWKSSQKLIRTLISTAARGGNLLLNVGPKPDGTIPKASVARLDTIGQWMQKNGEAIYATQSSPFPFLFWGRCTVKPAGDSVTVLYLHVFNNNSSNKLVLPGLENSILSAQALGSGTGFSYISTENEKAVILPPAFSTANTPVIKVIVKGKTRVTPFANFKLIMGKS